MRAFSLKNVLMIMLLGAIVVPSRQQLLANDTCCLVPSSTPSINRGELENLIRIRSQELESINKQLQDTQANLRTTKDKKAGLQLDLKNLDYNINQLQLNIQANKITSEKLSLEIDSLNYDVHDVEISIEQKKDTIIRLLQELQKKDSVSLFATFLKNESLADGFLETQSLINLRLQLAVDIASLKALHSNVNSKLREMGIKKQEVELNKKNLSARRSIVQDQKQERKVLLVQTQDKESLYKQQLEELTQQQDAVSDEIDKVEAQLRATFNVSLLPAKRRGVFAWPVQMADEGGKGILTQHFGEISYLYRGKPHNGLDIGVPIGTPVLAADDGHVLRIGDNDQSTWSKYQYGKYIVIKHSNGLATLYGHLSKQVVLEDQTIHKGDTIGYSGKTGYATGPHLHFGLYWADSLFFKSIPPAAGLVPIGVVIDPEGYL